MRGDPSVDPQFAELMELFDACCDAPPDERAARVADARARSPQLARRLQEMLAADDQPLFLDDARGAAQYLPGLAEQRVGGRWRLRDRLGAGSGGEVWSAEDAETGEVVAVKLIHPGLVDDPLQVARFRREFATMARLSHDGCLRLIAEGAVGEGVPLLDPGRRYLVTELVTGGDLSRLALAPAEEILPVLVQLLAALDHLHEQGVVHRDLKPSNVLLTGEHPPRPKLADFGVVKLAAPQGTDLTGDGSLLGTVDYLSPEQVRGEALDARSDLYAFGCLVHTLWTGRPPFEGPVVTRLWHRARANPPRLAERAPHAPAGLCALTDALLARDREQRPSSAREVAERLNRVLAELPARKEEGPANVLFPSGLVGRDALLERLTSRCARVRSERSPASVGLVGQAGVGKSTVSRTLLRRLEAEGWGVHVAPAMPLGAAPPFWPIPALIQRLAGRDSAEPETRPPDASERPREGSRRAARRLAEQLVASLGAETKPRCVLFEDAHAASRATLGVLHDAHAIAKERGIECVLLVTSRLQASEALSRLPELELHELPPLRAHESLQLAERLLGASQGSLSRSFVEGWLPEIAGNPLLLRAALQNLLDHGALSREDGVWDVRDDATLGDAVSDVLDRRLDGLSETSIEVLTVAAAIGERFDAGLLEDVVGSRARAEEALREGVRRAVLVREDESAQADGATHRFEHARLSERLVARVEGDALADLHDAIGEAWLARGAGTTRLAHHFGRGRDGERAARHLLAAAEEAGRAHDHAVRAQHLAALLARAEEPGVAQVAALPAIREDYADALAISGDHDAALEELRAMERAEIAPVIRARLLRKRGLVHLRTSAPAAGIEALRGSLALLEGAPPRTRLGRLVRLAWDAVHALVRRFFRGRGDGGRLEERALVNRELALVYRWVDLYDAAGHLARFSRLAQQLAPRHYRVDADAMLSMLFALQSFPGVGARFQRSARELATATGDLEGLARLTVIQGACELMLDDSDACLRRLDEGVALSRQTGDRMLVAFALSARAWARGIVGHIPDARAEFEEAEHEAMECGALWLATDAKCGRGITAVVMGRFDETRELAESVLTADLRLTFPIFEELAIEALAAVALLEGRYADATAGFERAHSILEKHRLRDGWGWLLPMSRVEALCSLADAAGQDAVPDLVRRLKRITPTFGRMDKLPLYVGCGEIARGVVDARRGRGARALRRLEKGNARRLSDRHSHVDTWVQVRSALERLRLGEDPDRVGERLDAIDQDYAARGLPGMQQWLAAMRGHLLA